MNLDNSKVKYSSEDETPVAELSMEGDIYVLSLINKDNRLTFDTIPPILKALDDIETDYKNKRAEAKKKEEDPRPAALVTIGNGRIYSSGLDYYHLISGKVRTKDFFDKFYHALCLKLLNMPFPTIAAINGHAFAAGLMLVFCHDYRIMREDRGYLCMPEVDIGTPITPGLFSVLRTSGITKKDLRDIMLQGKKISGKEALERGIIDKVASESDLLSKAIEFADIWAPKAAISDSAYKQIRIEMRSETIDLLRRGGLGFVPNL